MSEIPASQRDGCQFCLGAKGGVPGNENVVEGVVVCDYCHALLSKIRDTIFRDATPDVPHWTEREEITETDVRNLREANGHFADENHRLETGVRNLIAWLDGEDARGVTLSHGRVLDKARAIIQAHGT